MGVRHGEIVIDDSNWTEFLDPEADGHSRGLFPRDWAAEPFGSLPFAEPFTLPTVPRSEWSARIKEMEETQSRLSDIRRARNMPSQNQNGIPYCWIHAVASALRLLRAKQNEPDVLLSATAAGAQITNFRSVGGWSTAGLRWVVENGMPTTDLWPENKIDRRYLTPEMKANALLHRVTEWWECRGFDQQMTLAFYRIPAPVGYNWWGHAICQMDPVEVEPGSFGIRIWNSWSDSWGDRGEGVLRGSKAIADDCCAPRVTIPSMT